MAGFQFVIQIDVYLRISKTRSELPQIKTILHCIDTIRVRFVVSSFDFKMCLDNFYFWYL